MNHKFQIENGNSEPIVIWIEPWAHDFTLFKGEEITIETKGEDDPQFHLNVKELVYQLYINGEVLDWVAKSNNLPLECGHQRIVPPPMPEPAV